MKAKHRATALDRAPALWRQGYRPVIVNDCEVHMRLLLIQAHGTVKGDQHIATLKTYQEAVRFTGDIRHAGLRSGRKEHA